MLFFSLVLATCALAAPTSSPVVHEKRDLSIHEISHGRIRRVDREAILPIRIALAQSNIQDGYDHLMKVSDPTSEYYGKHWTVEEVHAKFAPSEETIEAVKVWLENAGVSREDMLESTGRAWIGVNIPAGDAERLFATEYYEHNNLAGKFDVGCDRYHVPSHLSDHIDYVTPGVKLSSVEKRSFKRTTGSSAVPVDERALEERALNPCGGELVTPACIKALYDIPPGQYNQPENALGVYEDAFRFDFDIYSQRDLDLFFENFAPNVPAGTHPELISINGATAPTAVNKSGSESDIDFDLAYSIVYPQTIKLYQSLATPDLIALYRDQAEGNRINKGDVARGRQIWNVLLDAVDGTFCTPAEKAAGTDCGTVELTRVLSVSYATEELLMPEAASKRACTEYMKLGLQGHTIVFASGDYGVGNKAGCVNRNHVGNDNRVGPVFNPYFPASCPYITAVGGTEVPPGGTPDTPEQVMHQPATKTDPPFSSGGGFSNYFPMPAYQASAVKGYLAKYIPDYPSYVYKGKDTVGSGGGIYASGGRAMPDVSANGGPTAFFNMGSPGGVSGTSLATPIFASMITLINQERTLAGKGPVGFINPVLYAHPEIFNDITTGTNPNCHTPGFPASPGWDPSTGLGTPSYPKMLELFLSLP